MDPIATIKKNLKRRSKIVDHDIASYQGVPLPTWIELSLIDVCNRSCSFVKIRPKYSCLSTNASLIDKLHDDLRKLNIGVL